MVHIDTTLPDRELTPGRDLWEITKAETGESRAKKEPMLRLEMMRVSDPQDRLFENIMLAGAGWGIGKKKLGALVPEGFKGDLDLIDLIGRRLWVSTGIEQYKGQDQLRVLISDLRCAGLQPEDEVPPGCAPQEASPDSDVPF